MTPGMEQSQAVTVSHSMLCHSMNFPTAPSWSQSLLTQMTSQKITKRLTLRLPIQDMEWSHTQWEISGKEVRKLVADLCGRSQGLLVVRSPRTTRGPEQVLRVLLRRPPCYLIPRWEETAGEVRG